MKRYQICLLFAVTFLSCSFILYKQQPKPTLFLIGDSTVRNGSKGDGSNMGQWGWGSYLANLFDTTKITIENRAMGGTSSRSYVTGKMWEKTLARVKPGDFVMMQFGHNDNGRGTVKGNGDDTIHVLNARTKEMEVIHSFGWNMRKYIAETRTKGATPIVCSLVPRNRWKDGKVIRDDHAHGEWAKQAAEQEKADFIDLNTIIADYYDKAGEAAVKGSFFAADPVHTIDAGARVSASLVVQGIKGLKNSPLQKYLLAAPADMANWKFQPSANPSL
jgi:lysophospholipase L1-like esterase